jgi:hypothetical protein
MQHIVRPSKIVTTTDGDSSENTGYTSMTLVDKEPSEWTESERDFMSGRDPKTAPLERRIAELEALLMTGLALHGGEAHTYSEKEWRAAARKALNLTKA